MTKSEVNKAYADWYREEQLRRSGCGGPVLMACCVIAAVLILSVL